MATSPFVQSVFHPSDFSESAHAAFAHALALVLYHQARFTILHVVPPDEAVDVWSDAPRVHETLERWGLLATEGGSAELLKQLALWVEKVNVRSADPLAATLHELEIRPSDLIVLANEERSGLPRWLRPSLAEGIARRSQTMTLFVPPATPGFVSSENGTIVLRRILVPIDHDPPPAAALLHAARAAVMSLVEPVEILVLRVGDEFAWPEIRLPEMASCSWTRAHRSGNVVQEIVTAAENLDADLIVMATSGARGVLDALRGTVTEQVLRLTSRPVLAVPAGRP